MHKNSKYYNLQNKTQCKNNLDITISRQKSLLDNIVFEETVDNVLLKNLINSEVITNIGNKKYNKIYDNNKIHLDNYLKKYVKSKKIIEVKYKIAKIGYGRVTPINSLSLGSIKRELRHTLAKDKYVDIDIVNAHPNIIQQICQSNNIPCKQLTKYINNRDEILNDVIAEYNISREQAKELFLILLYGGTFNTWTKENKINKKENKFIKNFYNEFLYISNIIVSKNIELENIVKKNKLEQKLEYHIGCTMSYYVQEYERRILEIIYLCLKNNNIINKNCVLCFDGIMIPIENYNDNILELLSKEVLDKLGFNLKFARKEIDEDLLEKLNEEIKNNNSIDHNMLLTFNSNYFDSLKNYEVKKIYWENFCCKIIFPEPCYIFTQYESSGKKYMEIMKKNMLKEAYIHLTFEEDNDVKLFIDYWLRDTNIRRYNRIDFVPKNSIELIQITDYYNLFPGWNPLVKTKYDISKRDLALKSFFELGIALCENNKKYFEYLIKFLAHMIQKPNERIPIAFIIKGKQGTGKNVFFNAICNLMDRKNFIVSSNPDDFFGTYAEGFYHKLLVNINECEGKDTFNYEGKIKSFITEETLTINPKFVRPTTINNYARLIICTNKPNPIPIDVKSIDRRFVVYETSDKYLDKMVYDTDFWLVIIEQFNKPQFIACLYDYLNNIDIDNWDFKRERPITNAYLEMCKLYIPIEAIYFENYIDQKRYEHFENKEKIVYINGFDMYNDFIKWANSNGFHREYKPSIIAFYAKIHELDLAITKVKIDGYVTLKFKVKEVYKKLTDKKWLSIMSDNIKEESNNYIKKDYSHLIVF